MRKTDIKGYLSDRKKKKTIIRISLLLVICCIAIGGIYFVSGKVRSKKGDRSFSIRETEATTGEISRTIIGTGTLAADISDSVTIPSGLVIDEVKVESGDSVSKGDILAMVDQTSVLNVIETIQEEIEKTDKAIEKSKNSSDTETISSKVAGRVKKIYVDKGSDVEKVMVEKGALLLLSIDGTMAVDIESIAGLAKGDSVTAVLSDGSKKSAVVKNISNGVCTITFSDDGVSVKEAVTIKTSGGKKLGNGEAYIHQPLKITATGGTVSKINVSENEKVGSKDTLLILDTDEMSIEYQKLIAQREVLADSLQKLLTISESGAITAKADGTIGDVNIQSSADSSSDGNASSGSSTQITSSAASAVKVVRTYQKAVMTVSTGNVLQLSAQAPDAVSDAAEDSVTEGKTEENTSESLQLQIVNSAASTKSSLGIMPPVTGAMPQTTLSVSDGSYSGMISWSPSAGVFAADTVYTAKVTLTASGQYCFSSNSISKIQTGTVSGVNIIDDGKKLQFQITFPSTEAAQSKSPESVTEEGGASGKSEGGSSGQSNQSSQNNQTSGTSKKSSSAGSSSKTQGNSLQNGNFSSGSSTASQSSVSGGSAEADISCSEEVTAFTMASDKNVLLSVNVDELDINSVKEKQEAEITLDAIENEIFTGTVTKVGNSSSSSSGGVAKYTVEISIPKEEQMKIGMNASATIVIEKKENVITIPVDALQERGGSSFVYTQKDEEGNLSGETEVMTGLSDGEKVEIIEGLSEGTAIYYQKTGISDAGSDNKMPNMEREGGFGRKGAGEDNPGDFKGNRMPSGDGSDSSGGFNGRGGDSRQGGNP